MIHVDRLLVRRTYRSRENREVAAVSVQVFESGKGVYIDDIYFPAPRAWCRVVGLSQPVYISMRDLRGSRGLKLWRAVRERAAF